MIAIGRPGETRGFALAGVETVNCRAPHDADAVLRSLAADTTVALVIVPAWLERVSAGSIARIRARRRAPAILALPDDDSTA
jgi:vacuolar-type H+-ATPase subunit F/Vma7